MVLTGAEIDQTAGLLSLRERSPFMLMATAATLAAVADNPMFGVLAPDVVSRRAITPGERFALGGGLQAELFMVPGKLPLYLEGDNPDTAEESAANVGVEIVRRQQAPRLCSRRCRNDAGAARAAVARRRHPVRRHALHRRRDDPHRHRRRKTGRRMGHMPIDGEGGSLAALAGLSARKIFVHINNTNPILVDGSPERRRVEAAGWEVAFDGMEIVL